MASHKDLYHGGPVTLTSTTAAPHAGETVVTREQLEKFTKFLAPLPDPLNGANTLYVTQENEHHARRLADASSGRIHVHVSEYASPTVIACFRDQECVAIIKLGDRKE